VQDEEVREDGGALAQDDEAEQADRSKARALEEVVQALWFDAERYSHRPDQAPEAVGKRRQDVDL